MACSLQPGGLEIYRFVEMVSNGETVFTLDGVAPLITNPSLVTQIFFECPFTMKYYSVFTSVPEIYSGTEHTWIVPFFKIHLLTLNYLTS